MGRCTGCRSASRTPSGRRTCRRAPGTPGLDGWTPPVDAAVVGTLREAGATITGKLALHELSTGVTSNNAHTGPVSNPYRLDHHTGGSSGGTAAAVAAGLIPVGLGGDTGGSCRIPAALCGCVGFRPTLGRWSQAGCVPISSTRDTPGPLGRSVQDVRMLDAVVTGDEPAATRSLEGLRLGVPRDPFYLGLEPSVAAIAEATLDLLATQGAVLVEVDLSALPDVNRRSGLLIPAYEAPREMAMYLLEHDAPFGAREVIDAIAGEPEREFWRPAHRARPCTARRSSCTARRCSRSTRWRSPTTTSRRSCCRRRRCPRCASARRARTRRSSSPARPSPSSPPTSATPTRRAAPGCRRCRCPRA